MASLYMESQVIIKLIIIGNAQVGKTSLAYRYTKRAFQQHYIMTLGSNFLVKEVQIGNTNVILQIWDTAGQERFRKLLPHYYEGARLALVVYSITDPESFEAVKEWVAMAKRYGREPFIMIVGNKSDLEDERKVSTKKGQNYAKSIKAPFLETSAKTSVNVDEAFMTLMKAHIEKLIAMKKSPPPA